MKLASLVICFVPSQLRDEREGQARRMFQTEDEMIAVWIGVAVAIVIVLWGASTTSRKKPKS
jgi:hypothetical protein